MKYQKKELFSQVKLGYLRHTNAVKLFSRFKLTQSLKHCNIEKSKGYEVIEMIYLMLVLILENASSINAGLTSVFNQKFKTPLNNMLNNEWYNWRKLLYHVASSFIKMYPANTSKKAVLIIDDTAKEKTGRYGQHVAWFVNHCKQTYYMGFQVVVAVYSNGKTTIPIDFELKIGKKKVKHSSLPNHSKNSHAKQREKMAKKSKLDIAVQFINRAMQRRYKFSYVIWDSWYVTQKTMSYVKNRLLPKEINLIAMVKRDHVKYLFKGKCKTINSIFKQSGSWKTDVNTDVKYKSVRVKLLDKASANKPEKRKQLISVKMCFYKYHKHKRYRVIISTEQDKSELEILKLYLRRWSIEVVFKELKQYFGFDQSKSSNYIPQVADLTIRCIFYIMFCSLREVNLSKSTQQLILEFRNDLEELSLGIILQELFKLEVKSLLKLSISYGYKEITELLDEIDKVLLRFFKSHQYENSIEEIDNVDFKKYSYKIAG